MTMWSKKTEPVTVSPITELSVEELAIRRKELDDEISRRGTEELERLKDTLIQVAHVLGYSVADLFPAQKTERKTRKKRQARKVREEEPIAEEIVAA
jgi:nitrate/nitrite-specific signal transduction histidine kinase